MPLYQVPPGNRFAVNTKWVSRRDICRTAFATRGASTSIGTRTSCGCAMWAKNSYEGFERSIASRRQLRPAVDGRAGVLSPGCPVTRRARIIKLPLYGYHARRRRRRRGRLPVLGLAPSRALRRIRIRRLLERNHPGDFTTMGREPRRAFRSRAQCARHVHCRRRFRRRRAVQLRRTGRYTAWRASPRRWKTARPARSHLAGNFPNPFSPSTTIRFVLDHAADVRTSASCRWTATRSATVRIRERVRRSRMAWEWSGRAILAMTQARHRSGVYYCRRWLSMAWRSMRIAPGCWCRDGQSALTRSPLPAIDSGDESAAPFIPSPRSRRRYLYATVTNVEMITALDGCGSPCRAVRAGGADHLRITWRGPAVFRDIWARACRSVSSPTERPVSAAKGRCHQPGPSRSSISCGHTPRPSAFPYANTEYERTKTLGDSLKTKVQTASGFIRVVVPTATAIRPYLPLRHGGRAGGIPRSHDARQIEWEFSIRRVAVCCGCRHAGSASSAGTQYHGNTDNSVVSATADQTVKVVG